MLNKQIHVWFTVLESRKWSMYDFHYNFIQKHFDAELLFTDKDSLTYEIKSKDVNEEFFKHKNLFDFSNYPKNFLMRLIKKLLVKWKTSLKEKVIDKFVGLNSKMHFMKNINGKESNTAKGVNITTEFSEFKDTLFIKRIIRHKIRRIQSKKHKKGT